jgi:hypothetical protein
LRELSPRLGRAQLPGGQVKRLPAFSQTNGQVHLPADGVDRKAGPERGNPPALLIGVRREFGDDGTAKGHALTGRPGRDARFAQAGLAQCLAGPEHVVLQLVQAALAHPFGPRLSGTQTFVTAIAGRHGTSVPDERARMRL